MKFRKKPVTIEAIQWLGSNSAELTTFVGTPPGTLTYPGKINGRIVSILEIPIKIGGKLFEGDLKAVNGDWIIRDSAGQLSTCTSDTFASLYEPIEEVA